MHEHNNAPGIIMPELTANSFLGASGAKYIIYPTLSVARYQEFERIEAEIGLASGNARRDVQKVYDNLNAGKVADATVTLYNILQGLVRIDENQHSRIMLACTLFINREGENVAEWSEAEAAEKINDWSQIDARFFLTCYRYFLTAFTASYGQTTPDISQSLNDEQADGSETGKDWSGL